MLFQIISGDHYSSDAWILRHLIHNIQHKLFHDSTESSGSCITLQGFFCDPFQSLILKQEKVVEFDWEKEKPAILLIVGMCVYIGLMLCIGYVLASLIVFPLVLFYVGERKPGPYIVVLVSAFAIFLLFKNVFNISLPALGLLGGII